MLKVYIWIGLRRQAQYLNQFIGHFWQHIDCPLQCTTWSCRVSVINSEILQGNYSINHVHYLATVFIRTRRARCAMPWKAPLHLYYHLETTYPLQVQGSFPSSCKRKTLLSINPYSHVHRHYPNLNYFRVRSKTQSLPLSLPGDFKQHLT